MESLRAEGWKERGKEGTVVHAREPCNIKY